MEVRESFLQLSHVNARCSPRVEDLLSKLKDASPTRLFFHQSAQRGSRYFDIIMERYPKQWQFYKEVRILNPRNVPDLNHDVANLSSLPLPTQNDAFAAEWQRYCRVEHVFPSDPATLWNHALSAWLVSWTQSCGTVCLTTPAALLPLDVPWRRRGTIRLMRCVCCALFVLRV